MRALPVYAPPSEIKNPFAANIYSGAAACTPSSNTSIGHLHALGQASSPCAPGKIKSDNLPLSFSPTYMYTCPRRRRRPVGKHTHSHSCIARDTGGKSQAPVPLPSPAAALSSFTAGGSVPLHSSLFFPPTTTATAAASFFSLSFSLRTRAVAAANSPKIAY